MGYEIKLIVGKQHSHFLGEEKNYFSKMAEVDLCKAGYDSNIHELHQNTNKKTGRTSCYFYADDGNTQIMEDCYGHSLIPADIRECLAALRRDAENDNYRRYKWAVALLESMVDDKEELEVIMFGH